MKTVLRIISKEGTKYKYVPNPSNVLPTKESHIVFKGESYIVSYTEFDFDENTLYIICITH